MNSKFANMTDDEIYKEFMKEDSKLIKKYLLKDDEATYKEKSALLMEKYKGTIVEQVEQQKYPSFEDDSADDNYEATQILPLEEIMQMEDANDFVVAYMDYLNDKCDYGENLDMLTEKEKTVFYVDTMNSEVHSKGFKEYLKSDDFPGFEVLENALQAIGASATHEIVKDVEKKPKWMSFNKIDDRFYDYPDNIEQLIMNYAKIQTEKGN